MSNKIIIQNIGPIKDVSLDLNKVNIFIGSQSSGKSTIAKIISFCTWVEKNAACNQSLDNYFTDKNYFRERLETFHKIKGYFNPQSVIQYQSEILKLHYTSQNFSIEWVDQYAYKRSKISYVPAERSMVILPEIEKVEFPHNNIRSFLFDWLDARKHYSNEESLPILDLGFQYYYSESAKEDRIRLAQNGNGYDILLPNASSGLQSMTPMIAMVDYLTNWIYAHEENLSYEQEEAKRSVTTKLISKLILKPYFGQDFPNKEERKTKVDEINEKIKDRDSKVLELFEKYKTVQKNLFTTQNSQLIIEEPEQNLFPDTQRNLVYYLLEKCNDAVRNHRMTLTTHSPYILYALNNCMMAGLVYGKMSDEDKQRIQCGAASIDPKTISVYQLCDGTVNCIQQEDGLIGDNYFDNKMKELMDDFYIMLNYYQ